MKYGELIHIDPIDSVVQLRSSGQLEPARRLARSYVVSDTMAERLVALVLPQLQFDQPADQKGLLVVGNYGTGKSHLMSVLAAVAEDAALLADLRHDGLRAEAARTIAGRFKVIRVEIGGTVKALRDILLDELQDGLSALGVNYTFPRAFEVTGYKAAFEKMMALFAEAYPDHGLLLVVDELLDYLRSRKEQELVLDLSFLREIGEVCRDLRFRFIAGVQEALFDSPRFQFAADSMRRVKARFEQVHIARTDIQFVVAQRLLRKTAAQEQRIRAHLQPFTNFYAGMSDRLDEFVRLFPVHPDYFEVFERLIVAEKREVLKTLSRAMQDLEGRDVPADAPGLLAFDSYWATLRDDPVFRADPAIRQVVDCSDTLAQRSETALKNAYKPTARRLIAALSVHRLTLDDVYRPVGITAEELRDRLCLFDPFVAQMGGADPERDLLTHVEAALREIHKAVAGQFLTMNVDNGQWHLDLKKTVDFDAKIADKAAALDADKFDAYFFDALKTALECTDEPHRTGFHIWQHELTWKDRNSPRAGYLFFGTPNERSTAAPPRDFYLYFLQPNQPPAFKNEKKSDEVFFRLKKPDDEFDRALRDYAAASELAAASTGSEKKTYLDKAAEHRRRLLQWVSRRVDENFEVGYQGRWRLLGDLQREATRQFADSSNANFRDRVNSVAAHCMAAHFADTAPNSPKFSVLITGANRAQAAQDALNVLAAPTGQKRTKQAVAVLDALRLLDGERITTMHSPYARAVVEQLRARPAGQVLNRDELITSVYGIEYMPLDGARLEPEWAVVVLAALVYAGEITLSLPGRRFDATALPALAAAGVDELSRFKHLQAPSEWHLSTLTAMFTLLDLAPGLAEMMRQGSEEPLGALTTAAVKEAQRIAALRAMLDRGLLFWSLDWSPVPEQSAQIAAYQKFLESLSAYRTLGQLKNFRPAEADLTAHAAARRTADEFARRDEFKRRFDADLTWLTQAEGVLPADGAFAQALGHDRAALIERLQRAGSVPGALDGLERETATVLKSLRVRFVDEYRALHARARLDTDADRRKAALIKDERMKALIALATIPLLPRKDYTDLTSRLDAVRSCAALTEADLTARPVCPHCSFRPASEPALAPADEHLKHAEYELERIHKHWTEQLLANLDDPSLQGTLDLMDAAARGRIEQFRSRRVLPMPVDSAFVQSLGQAFAGLERVTVSLADLAAALQSGDGPATADELQKRFAAYVDSLTRGRDPKRVRLVVM